jgi:phenylalanyl-tRNA synthetase alpha chain
MSISILSAAELRRALNLRDLTDPEQGPHAMQLVLDVIASALRGAWGIAPTVSRHSPIVSIRDNYDRLHYPPDGAARDARYTRYVCETAVLRTHTSAQIPPLLTELAASPPADALLVAPGVVYRRDSIDRLHTGEPHQVDLWRIRRGPPLEGSDLERMVELVVGAVLPGRRHRTRPTEHPYTVDGLEIEVESGASWVEIGECGLALSAVLDESGLPAGTTGLAMGLGLDRVLMLAKGIDDIRILRSPDPRIAPQLLDLEPYRPISRMPAVRRDLSLVLDEPAGAAELGDRVRSKLGDRSELVESLQVLSDTPYLDLPAHVTDRLGMRPGQRNTLVSLVLRAVDRTLTDDECNELRNAVYAALNRGLHPEWAR